MRIDEGFKNILEQLRDLISWSSVSLAELFISFHDLGISLPSLTSGNSFHVWSDLNKRAIDFLNILDKESDRCIFAQLEYGLYFSANAPHFILVWSSQILFEGLNWLFW